MAVFTIQSPDGRKITIEAPDEATAMAGAQDYVSKNPVGQQPVTGAQDQQPSLLGSALSTANHMVTDIPVVGPAMQWAGDQLAGQTIGRLSGMTPDQYIQKAEAARGQMDEANPIARVAGGLAGNLGAVGLTSGTSTGAEALGLAGKTLPRMVNGALSYTGLTAADNMVRGDRPADALANALMQGPSIGGVTVPGSAIAAAIPGIGTGARALAKGLTGGVETAAVPTSDALKQAAGDLYDTARASGAQASQASTIKLSDQMFQIARDEGLVSPTGRIAQSYPRINDVLKTFDDYANGSMSVPQMQAVRRTLQDAAGSADAGERRVGVEMLHKFDDFAASVAPDLRDASALYRSAKKGELIDTAMELAGSRAGQFSGSGFENALRTEFRGLERKIINGQLKGISEEEKAAISKVAQGGPISNVARWIGKFAPTGAISTGISGGVPFFAGNAIGGPALGAGAAAGTMGAALLARAGATKMGVRNAEIAGALMRNGGRSLPATSTPKVDMAQQVAQALLIGGAN